MTSSGARGGEPYESAWQKVEERWGEDEAHREFIALCSARGSLAEAGRRYRAVREADPLRSERANAQLNAVLGLAFATLDGARSRPRPPRSKLFWIGCGVGLVLTGYAILAVLRLLAS